MYAGYFMSLPYWKGEGEINFPTFTLTLIYLKKKKNYLFLVVLGFHCWAQAFSSCGQQGLLSSYAVIVVACVVAEHGL